MTLLMKVARFNLLLTISVNPKNKKYEDTVWLSCYASGGSIVLRGKALCRNTCNEIIVPNHIDSI